MSKVTLIVPLYKSLDTKDSLVQRIMQLREQHGLEVVLVDDGCPQQSGLVISSMLEGNVDQVKTVWHSRNFGSYAAIKTGITYSTGENIIVMSADLQEPVSLVNEMIAVLDSNDAEVVIAARKSREDSRVDHFFSRLYWKAYRIIVNRDVPRGGVDVFGCSANAAKALLRMGESRTSLIGQLFWIGFNRQVVYYDRQKRQGNGSSAWTFRKKFSYLADSVFSFSYAPIKVLQGISVISFFAATYFSGLVILQRLNGSTPVQGYTVIVLSILISFSLVTIYISIISSYIIRTFENSKGREFGIVSHVHESNRTIEK